MCILNKLKLKQLSLSHRNTLRNCKIHASRLSYATERELRYLYTNFCPSLAEGSCQRAANSPVLLVCWASRQPSALAKKKFPDANKILGVGSHPEHPVMVVCQA